MLSRYSADIVRHTHNASGKFNVFCHNPVVMLRGIPHLPLSLVGTAVFLTLCPLLSHRSLAHDHYESIKPQMMSFRCYERNNIAQVSN